MSVVRDAVNRIEDSAEGTLNDDNRRKASD